MTELMPTSRQAAFKAASIQSLLELSLNFQRLMITDVAPRPGDASHRLDAID